MCVCVCVCVFIRVSVCVFALCAPSTHPLDLFTHTHTHLLHPLLEPHLLCRPCLQDVNDAKEIDRLRLWIVTFRPCPTNAPFRNVLMRQFACQAKQDSQWEVQGMRCESMRSCCHEHQVEYRPDEHLHTITLSHLHTVTPSHHHTSRPHTRTSLP